MQKLIGFHPFSIVYFVVSVMVAYGVVPTGHEDICNQHDNNLCQSMHVINTPL